MSKSEQTANRQMAKVYLAARPYGMHQLARCQKRIGYNPYSSMLGARIPGVRL